MLVLIALFALAEKPPAGHRLSGTPRPWVQAAERLAENPTAFRPHQTAEPKGGLTVYEFVDQALGDRRFETVLLAVRGADDFVLELTPGGQGPPIQPEELGDVLLLGEGENYWVFRVLEGPFEGDYLIWSTATGHRGVGGEAVRIYTPAALAREPALRGFAQP